MKYLDNNGNLIGLCQYKNFLFSRQSYVLLIDDDMYTIGNLPLASNRSDSQKLFIEIVNSFRDSYSIQPLQVKYIDDLRRFNEDFQFILTDYSELPEDLDAFITEHLSHDPKYVNELESKYAFAKAVEELGELSCVPKAVAIKTDATMKDIQSRICALYEESEHGIILKADVGNSGSGCIAIIKSPENDKLINDFKAIGHNKNSQELNSYFSGNIKFAQMLKSDFSIQELIQKPNLGVNTEYSMMFTVSSSKKESTRYRLRPIVVTKQIVDNQCYLGNLIFKDQVSAIGSIFSGDTKFCQFIKDTEKVFNKMLSNCKLDTQSLDKKLPIIGIDFLIDKSGNPKIFELNPRKCGMTRQLTYYLNLKECKNVACLKLGKIKISSMQEKFFQTDINGNIAIKKDLIARFKEKIDSKLLNVLNRASISYQITDLSVYEYDEIENFRIFEPRITLFSDNEISNEMLIMVAQKLNEFSQDLEDIINAQPATSLQHADVRQDTLLKLAS